MVRQRSAHARLPLQLQRYVLGLREWHQREELKSMTMQRGHEQRRREAERVAAMSPAEREAYVAELAVRETVEALIKQARAM